jgi:pimeloyl-ACP methyl ester carboxylesterase
MITASEELSSAWPSLSPMDLVLIPGLWLDGSSWDAVVPVLERAGHRTHPLTLPGMDSLDADRSMITLRDHVHAVVAMIDSLDPTNRHVVLVGHSGGGAIAHAAVDARPDRVERVVYVDSVPLGDGGTSTTSFRLKRARSPCRIGRSSTRRTSLILMMRCGSASGSAPSRRPFGSPLIHSDSPTTVDTTCRSP